ncbi:hypothetical protein MTO96_049728 [Rhipicephalus appendiculatus]
MRQYGLPDVRILACAPRKRSDVCVFVKARWPSCVEQTRCAIPVSSKVFVTFVGCTVQGASKEVLVLNRTSGGHQTTVSRCIKDVSIALVDTAVRKRWLAFPRTASERAFVKERFLRRGSITGVVGCVDGTYIGIKAPSKSNRTTLKAKYFTRKAHYALNTMVVRDADLRILDIDARFPGSCHDAHVWGKSALRRHFELGRLIDDGDCLLASARRQLFAKGKTLRDTKLRLFQQGRAARLRYLNRVRQRMR